MAADAALRHGAVTLMAWPASEAFAVGWLQRESQACLLVPLPAAGPWAIRYWPPSDVGRFPAESQGAGTLVAFSLAALQRYGQAGGLESGAPDRLHSALLCPQVVPVLRPRQRFVGQALTSAVALIHQAAGFGSAPLLSTLALDALVLRSLVLLLLPDQAMAWMLARLDHPISLADLEREIGYSRRSLQLGFGQRVGCGPIQWLRRQRLSLAHERITTMAGMLRQGGLTLTVVARQCGYSNLASFSRDFSSLYGYPPSQLLRQA
jgi:AraC-like DNA-binding protein